jgi:hypothetical protein
MNNIPQNQLKYFLLFDTDGLACTTTAPYYPDYSDSENWILLNEKIYAQCENYNLGITELPPRYAYAQLTTDFGTLSRIQPLDNFVYFGEDQ